MPKFPGTVSGNNTAKNVNYFLDATLNWQDPATNKSNITLHHYAQSTSSIVGAHNLNGNAVSQLKVNGSNVINRTQNMDFRNCKLVDLGTWTDEVEHNSEGKLTLSLSGLFDMKGSSSSVTGGSVNATWTLPTIARKSSVSATNATIGGTSTITINKQSSSFTHTLTYSFGSLSGTIATKTSASSVNFTVPTSFYAQIPNSKNGTCTITCTTFSGDTNVGSTTTTFTASCNEAACKPHVSATVVDTNSNTTTLTGDSSKLVRYKSTARVTISATAKNSASITSRSIEGTSVSSYLDIPNISKNSFSVSATDSRGYSTTITKTATMINYVQLTCNASFKRANQTSSVVNLTYSGNYFNGSFGATSNTLTMSWKYREKGSSTWISGGALNPTKSGNMYSGSIQCGTNFDYEKSYEFQIDFADKIDSLNTGAITLPKGQGSFEIYDKAIKANGEVLFYWD